jgi:hypothetical protein
MGEMYGNQSTVEGNKRMSERERERERERGVSK